jgi:hypothetical protein
VPGLDTGDLDGGGGSADTGVDAFVPECTAAADCDTLHGPPPCGSWACNGGLCQVSCPGCTTDACRAAGARAPTATRSRSAAAAASSAEALTSIDVRIDWTRLVEPQKRHDVVGQEECVGRSVIALERALARHRADLVDLLDIALDLAMARHAR